MSHKNTNTQPPLDAQSVPTHCVPDTDTHTHNVDGPSIDNVSKSCRQTESEQLPNDSQQILSKMIEVMVDETSPQHTEEEVAYLILEVIGSEYIHHITDTEEMIDEEGGLDEHEPTIQEEEEIIKQSLNSKKHLSKSTGRYFLKAYPQSNSLMQSP